MDVECLSTGISPVTLEVAKQHLRVIGDEFNDNITGMVEAATSAAEHATGLILRKNTYRVTCDFSLEIYTKLMPIREIEIKIDGKVVEGVKVRGSRVFLPEMTGEAVEMTVQTGYENLPHDIRAAILLIAGKLFDTPSDSVENLPKASTNLLKHYRRWDR